jgi:hypothetical protein
MRMAILCILVVIPAMAVSAQLLNNDLGTASRDTMYQSPDTSTAPKKDTLSAQSSTKLVVVKRDFKYREQIGIALAMMAFVAFMMTTSETFNPR